MSTCAVCGSPRADGTRACRVCARYRQLARVASAPRKASVFAAGTAPGLAMTPVEYAAWYAARDRACVYCRLSEEDLPLAGFRTQNGHPLVNLGIDRLDNSRPYEVGNIAECCLACNQVKSNRYTHAEMLALAPALQVLHAARVAAARAALTR